MQTDPLAGGPLLAVWVVAPQICVIAAIAAVAAFTGFGWSLAALLAISTGVSAAMAHAAWRLLLRRRVPNLAIGALLGRAPRPTRLTQLRRGVLLATVSFALSGCITSEKPLLDEDSRALPFASPTTFQVFERENAQAAWRRKPDMTLTADRALVVRMEGNASETQTFHPLGNGRFLVQGHFGKDTHYAYALLEVRNGEGLLNVPACPSIDQRAFEAAGGTVVAKRPDSAECKLDAVADPRALLTAILATPTDFQQRFVPVR